MPDGTINKLGKALKKHNFERLKKGGIYVYALTEFSWDNVESKNKEIETPAMPSNNTQASQQKDITF
jgi:hypothetical protein